jgi:hypothetical protein
MKATLALALFCLVGVSACSTQSSSTPEAAAPAEVVATEVAACGCGHKAAECGCAKCKATKGTSCECSNGACGHKGYK